MDEDPMAKININGEEYFATRQNSAVFGHLGKLTMFDHIFIQTEDPAEESVTGAYIFRHAKGYHILHKYLVENLYPVHLNLPDVAECDQAAFERSIEQDLQDMETGVPEEWLNQS